MALIQSWDIIRDSLGYPCSNHKCYDNAQYTITCIKSCPYHYGIEWIDTIGGHHKEGYSINPCNVICKDCTKESCETCHKKTIKKQ